MSNEEEKNIADLQARMKTVESKIIDIESEQKTIRSKIECIHIEEGRMGEKLDTIKRTLEEMASKKIRGVDVAIAVGVLFSSGISAYAAVRMIELTKVMIDISKTIP
jgi:septal ring factor EnvC (AmiA/AmiB activator)